MQHRSGAVCSGRSLYSNVLAYAKVAYAVKCRCIPVAYSVILMVLALYKAAQVWNETQGTKGTELVKILIQDQVIYFGG